MIKQNNSKNLISNWRFLVTALAIAFFLLIPLQFGCKTEAPPEAAAPAPVVDSNFGGVQIGAITYSWRSMPSSAEDVLQYCLDTGISSIELMGNVAEEFAGIPAGPSQAAKRSGTYR